MINTIQIPPLGKTIHLFLFVIEGEIQSWDHSIKLWSVFLQSLQSKAFIYPVLLPSQKETSHLAQLQEACAKWQSEYQGTNLNFVSPENTPLPPSLSPRDDSNPESIIIHAPLAGVFVRHALLKNMLGKLETAHIVGGKRVAENYSFPLRVIHTLFSLVARILFCIPISPICGPTSIGERLKNWFARFLFGLRYEDTLFPVRMFRLQVLEKAWPQSQGNFFGMELAARANFLGFLFAEEESWHESDPKLKKISLWTRGDSNWWSDLTTLLKTPRFLKTPVPLVNDPKTFSENPS